MERRRQSEQIHLFQDCNFSFILFFYFGGFIVQTFGQLMPVMDGVAEVLPPGREMSK